MTAWVFSIGASDAACRSDREGIWRLLYDHTESLGCAYPGEPAGVAIRIAMDAHQSDISRLQVLVDQTVTDCDLCFGYCTVEMSTKEDLGER